MIDTPSQAGPKRARISHPKGDCMPRGQAIRSPALWERSPYRFALIASIGMFFLILNSEIHATHQTQAKAWPDPLVLQSDVAVRDRAEFEQQRRGEILHLFEENVYGRTPSISFPVRIPSTEVHDDPLQRRPHRKQITFAMRRT